MNNLKQVAVACQMYGDDMNGFIPSLYPYTADGNTGGAMAACTPTATPASYTYGGADPTGIQSGLLWPYSKSLGGTDHCPAANYYAQPGYPDAGKPILRSISMNSFLCGQAYGTSTDWNPLNLSGAQDPNFPVYIKQIQILQPTATWLVVDEDPATIDDAMFLMDVSGKVGFMNLPSRNHGNAYGNSVSATATPKSTR